MLFYFSILYCDTVLSCSVLSTRLQTPEPRTAESATTASSLSSGEEGGTGGLCFTELGGGGGLNRQGFGAGLGL